jgi:hypothetical protein
MLIPAISDAPDEPISLRPLTDTRPAGPRQLPTPATPLIGRKGEVAQVVCMLRGGDVRLLNAHRPRRRGEDSPRRACRR